MTLALISAFVKAEGAIAIDGEAAGRHCLTLAGGLWTRSPFDSFWGFRVRFGF